jgi:hypothetical protein
MRSILLLFALATFAVVQAQTHFYVNSMAVVPAQPTTSDQITLQLIGDLSDTGASIQLAEATVTGYTVSLTLVAVSDGGLTVLVPHTENIPLGQLPAGTYTVSLSGQSAGIWYTGPPFTFTVSGGGGAPCDQLELVSVQWQAFGDSALVVHVLNGSQEIFSYPNFILFNAQGDTLAMETVQFFGIAGESWHMLRIVEGVGLPGVPFVGRLELWTLFTTELACIWEQTFDLCPPPPCQQLTLTLMGTGGTVAIGEWTWQLLDDLFNPMASGVFELTSTEQFGFAEVCLPAGNYSWNVSPVDPGQQALPVYYVTGPGWQETLPTTATPSLPALVPFTVYGPCISGTNAIADRESLPTMITAATVAGGVLVQRIDGGSLGATTIYDAHGRSLFTTTSAADRIFIPLEQAGVYLLRAGQEVIRFAAGLE